MTFTCDGCKFKVDLEVTPQQKAQGQTDNLTCHFFPPVPIILVHPEGKGIITTDTRPTARGGCGQWAPDMPGTVLPFIPRKVEDI